MAWPNLPLSQEEWLSPELFEFRRWSTQSNNGTSKFGPHDRREGGRVITVIEFVNPTNKRSGEGLTKYRQKQQECREGGVNLVEIDLTRNGDRSLIMPLHRLKTAARTTYQAWVSRANELQTGWAYCLPLSKRLEAIPIPLRPADSDVLLDLQPLVDRIYETGRYSVDLDYTEPLEPPLSPADAEWTASLLLQRPSSEPL